MTSYSFKFPWGIKQVQTGCLVGENIGTIPAAVGGMRVAFLFTEFTQLFILLFLEGRATGFAIQIIFEMKTLELRSWIKLKDKTLAAFLLLIFEKA